VSERHQYRSFFWPGMLILAGILALLVNTGALSVDRLNQLLDLWPLILIVLGLELIVRRSLQGRAADLAAALIVVTVLVGAAAYVALGPVTPEGTRHFVTSDSLYDLKQATLEIDAGSATLHVQGSSSLTQDLYQAQVTYSGPVPKFTLDREGGRLVIAQSGRLGFLSPTSLVLWIQLNSTVRWSFVIHSGSSTDTYDLANLAVGSMEVETGASREDIRGSADRPPASAERDCGLGQRFRWSDLAGLRPFAPERCRQPDGIQRTPGRYVRCACQRWRVHRDHGHGCVTRLNRPIPQSAPADAADKP
jgi:hypothetical protein